MALSRTVIRCAEAERERLDALRAQYRDETNVALSRSALIRRLARLGMDNLREAVPLHIQLPVLPAEERQHPVQGPGPSMRTRIVDILKQHPETVFTAADLQPMLNVRSRGTIRSTLSTLANLGQIQRAGAAGHFRALAGSGGA